MESDLTTPTGKEKAIFFLKSLIELLENDSIHADEIVGKTAAEVIAMAEAEAAKAVEDADKLKNG